MLQQHVQYVFHLFQTYVASVLSGCCICYNDYVASVCLNVLFVSVVYCNCFILSVAKVNLNVGLFSEEEGASAGAMAASAVSWRHRSIGGRAGGSFLYDMLPPLAHRRS
jgi:hypothetical protein